MYFLESADLRPNIDLASPFFVRTSPFYRPEFVFKASFGAKELRQAGTNKPGDREKGRQKKVGPVFRPGCRPGPCRVPLSDIRIARRRQLGCDRQRPVLTLGDSHRYQTVFFGLDPGDKQGQVSLPTGYWESGPGDSGAGRHQTGFYVAAGRWSVAMGRRAAYPTTIRRHQTGFSVREEVVPSILIKGGLIGVSVRANHPLGGSGLVPYLVGGLGAAKLDSPQTLWAGRRRSDSRAEAAKLDIIRTCDII